MCIEKLCWERNFKIVKILTKSQQNLVSTTRIDTNNNKALFMYYLIPGNYISVRNFPSHFFQYTKILTKKVKWK